jgi:hypothetical protein
MHAAPSVSYPVGRSRFAALWLAVIALLGLAAAVTFALQSPVFGWRQAAGFAAVLACAGIALAAWLRSPVGQLHWDGAGWQWEEGGQTGGGRLAVALDVQSRLLLHWRGEDRSQRWLWLARDGAPAHWDALRRAVYSPATQQAPRPDPPVAGDGVAER